MSAPKGLTSRGQQVPKVIATVVCDIRDFTELTAHVHEFVSRPTTVRKRADVVLKQFLDLITVTQQDAERLLTPKSLLAQRKFARKGTGDGLMLSVPLGAWPPEGRLDDEWIQRAGKTVHEMAQRLVRYINSRKMAPGNTLASRLEAFLTEFGRELGIPGDSKTGVPKKPSLRLAGAMTLGLGFLFTAKEDAGSSTGGTTAYAVSPGDAFGHPVNLAFRLCGEAARLHAADTRSRTRFPPGDKETSPNVLFDKHVGHVLLRYEKLNRPRKVIGVGPYARRLAMKGVEETWCYSLRKAR